MKRFKTYKEFESRIFPKFSDKEMKNLIDDLINNFNIENLKWEHNDLTSSDLKWEYNIDPKTKIKLRRKDGDFYGYNWDLSINYDSFSLSQISKYLLNKLANFFIKEEKKERRRKNTENFDKASITRKEAEKYNL